MTVGRGVNLLSEEVKNPGRDIPRSLFGGVLTIAAIYLLVNIALLYVLPMSRIAGKEFAAGEAANAIFGAHGDTIFRCLTIASMLSGINALHLMATRVIFAMSRDGLFMRRAAAVNEGGTPSCLVVSERVGGGVVHRVRTKVRSGDNSAGVLLRSKLHPFIRFALRVATARAGQAAAVSGLGLSGDARRWR
jgi:amino acid permease